MTDTTDLEHITSLPSITEETLTDEQRLTLELTRANSLEQSLSHKVADVTRLALEVSRLSDELNDCVRRLLR